MFVLERKKQVRLYSPLFCAFGLYITIHVIIITNSLNIRFQLTAFHSEWLLHIWTLTICIRITRQIESKRLCKMTRVLTGGKLSFVDGNTRPTRHTSVRITN